MSKQKSEYIYAMLYGNSVRKKNYKKFFSHFFKLNFCVLNRTENVSKTHFTLVLDIFFIMHTDFRWNNWLKKKLFFFPKIPLVPVVQQKCSPVVQHPNIKHTFINSIEKSSMGALILCKMCILLSFLWFSSLGCNFLS